MEGDPRRRLAALEAEIERLQRARGYLEGALLCRYDHPATDCRIMGAEIDRRLTPTRPPTTHECTAATCLKSDDLATVRTHPAGGKPAHPTGQIIAPVPAIPGRHGRWQLTDECRRVRHHRTACRIASGGNS